MLNLAGRDALERSKEFEFESAEVEAKLANWKAKFYELCQPMKNIIVLRHGFFSKHQKEGENFNSFVTSLRSKAKACEFGAMKDEMIRDRIVCGINDSKTRSVLFSKPNLILKRAIEICELQESAESSSMHKTSTQDNHKKDSSKCKFCGSNHSRKECPAYGKTCAKLGKRNNFATLCKSFEDRTSSLKR